MNDQRATTSHEQEGHEDDQFRDIHPLTPLLPPPGHPGRRREAWETISHRSSSLSSEGALSENFTTISREFNALVIAGSAIANNNEENSGGNNGNNLARIREDDTFEETNPLAIVPDNNPPLDLAPSPQNARSATTSNHGDISMQRVKKEEVETKITAWQTAKVAKINNRYKREEAIINGWEGERVQKATSWMKKVERKLEEKRARALEKMQNDIAKAHQKAEERRASAESKRGTKVARVLEVANLMKAVGRAPVKRSLF
ncbi:Remorin, C-terminal [Dillenia turbinata]|uniref:Remorin, C-terminal n=1 Tax=Dillenia turbinata TaxID=194707 RepID=A0AAN8W8V3_9MAGN